jgi:penicillin-binding protein 2
MFNKRKDSWGKTYLNVKNSVKEKLLFNRRLVASIVLILILTILLAARLCYLQIDQGKHYNTLATNNEISLVPIPPKRGLIYSRDNLLLAKNIPVYSLMVIPDKVHNMKQELTGIQKIIPLRPADLKAFKRQLKEHRRFQEVPLKAELTAKQVATFAVNTYHFPGFEVKADLIRYYPQNSAFAHIIGYVGRISPAELASVNQSNYAETNYFGKTGIERYFQTLLHGEVGYQQVETDASGRIVKILSKTPPVSGTNLYLTIDSKLQIAAEKAMQGHQGVVLAIQPSTGQVLAMVSEPSFNPNLFVQGISEKNYKKLRDNPFHPLYNRSVHGLYAIASTIKPMIGLEALMIKAITPEFQFFDPGWFRIPHTKHIFHGWKPGGHGWVNLHKAIVVSCDVYFYKLAYKIGIAPIDKILTIFGYGKPTGIQLPNELAGHIPSPAYKKELTNQPWYAGDTVNSSIGQGYMQATPIQMLSAVSMIAERGRHFKPTLLYAIQPPGKPKILLPPDEVSDFKVADKKDWKVIINAMADVIPDGVGHSFGKTPYTVAAKTGTAQVISDHGNRFARKPYLERADSIIEAFAPIKHPKIAIIVIVEHSPGASEHVARAVMDEYLLKEHHWHPKKETKQ